MASRTYLRSSIARSVYQKMLNDQSLRSLDKSKWYSCNVDSLSSEVTDRFILSQSDEETEVFLDECFKKSEWFFLQIYHTFARALLCWFMSKTSINGLLGRGFMFVYSNEQFVSLLGPALFGDKPLTLLDLGAGDGNVTRVMAPHFADVYTTEISQVMRNILQSKGYRVLDVNDWWKRDVGPAHYDVISCLNLLDRCDMPKTMLKQMRAKLMPETGRLVVAVVLPFHQYVESASDRHNPRESVQIIGETFEEQVSNLCLHIFPELGFEVLQWTRLPYLCEGDLQQSYYWLDDAVFVLKTTPTRGVCDLNF